VWFFNPCGTNTYFEAASNVAGSAINASMALMLRGEEKQKSRCIYFSWIEPFFVHPVRDERRPPLGFRLAI